MTFAAVTEPKIIDEAAKQNQHSAGWVGPSAKRQIYDDEAPKGLLTPHRRYGGKRMYEDTSKGDSYDDTKKRDIEESSDVCKRITKKAIPDKQPQLIMAGLPGGNTRKRLAKDTNSILSRDQGVKKLFEDVGNRISNEDNKKREAKENNDAYERLWKMQPLGKQRDSRGLYVIPDRLVSPGLGRGSGRLIKSINTADRHKDTMKREAKENTNGYAGLMKTGPPATGLQRDSRGFQYIPIGLVSPGSGGGVKKLIKTINIADRHKDTKKREAKENTNGYAGLMKTGPPGLQRDSRGFQYIQQGLVSPGSGGGVERLIKTINIADRHKDTKKREAKENTNGYAGLMKTGPPGLQRDSHGFQYVQKGLVSPGSGRGAGRLIKTINIADRHKDARKREAEESSSSHQNNAKKVTLSNLQGSHDKGRITRGYVGGRGGKRLVTDVKSIESNGDIEKREAKENSVGNASLLRKVRLENTEKREAKENGDETTKVLRSRRHSASVRMMVV